MPKISALPPDTTANPGDIFPLVDVATSVTKKIRYDQFPYNSSGASRLLAAKLGDIVSIKDPPFLAVGDGLADDTAALNAAFASAGRFVFLPKGNYKFTSNLIEPICSGILGEGENNTFITANTGVTKALPLGTACTVLRDFQIVGNATTNATGIIFGDTAIGAYAVDNVLVQNFTGTGANGVKLSQAVKSKFKRLTVSGCTQGMLVDATGGGGLTTCSFDECVFRASTGIGVKGVAGSSIGFHACIFESNGAEGIKLIPGAGGTLIDILIDEDCWFEANWGASAGQYQFVADGSGGTCRFQFRDSSFQSSGAKSIHVTGAGAIGWIINNPQVPNSAATILIENSAGGICYEWPANLPYNTCVSDTARTGATITFGMENFSGSWLTWTPVFASNIGDVNATFTVAPTVTNARARYIGKTLSIQLDWNGTLKAVTPGYIQISLPSSLISQSANVLAAGITVNNAVQELGQFLPDAAGNIKQFRMALNNYTSGGAVGGSISMDIETV